MHPKPKPWLAALLNVIAAPLGFLYVGKGRWALAYIAVLLVLTTVSFLGLAPSGFAILQALILVLLFVGSVVMAYRVAKRSVEGRRQWSSRWYGMLGIAAALVFTVLLIRVFLYEPFRAPSTSMAPTIPAGSNIVVEKIGYGHFSTYGLRLGQGTLTATVKRGDIMVFDFPVDPSQTYVKRVVGLPGDHVVYRDKHLVINGRDSRLGRLDDYQLVDRELPRTLQQYQEQLDGTVFATLQVEQRPPLGAAPKEFAFRTACTYSADGFVCDVPPGNFFVMGDNRDYSYDSRYWGFVRSELVIGKVVKIIEQ